MSTGLELIAQYRDHGASSLSDDELEVVNSSIIVHIDEDSDSEFNKILELTRIKRVEYLRHQRGDYTESSDGEQVEDDDGDERKSSEEENVQGGQRLSSKTIKKQMRTFDGEYYNLPVVEAPQIQVNEKVELKKFGVVLNFIDFIVVIKPIGNVPHLNYDTVLFNAERNAVGAVFEVFGSVQNTLYSIRFNSMDEAKGMLKLGDDIFFAPTEKTITKTVLTNQLQNMKISDPLASDEECTFSDDEAEREYCARNAAKKRGCGGGGQFQQQESNSRRSSFNKNFKRSHSNQNYNYNGYNNNKRPCYMPIPMWFNGGQPPSLFWHQIGLNGYYMNQHQPLPPLNGPTPSLIGTTLPLIEQTSPDVTPKED